MNRRLFTAALAIALALPVLLLGVMIYDAERRQREGETVRVVLRGYDPRDLLRGRYITYQFDRNVTATPSPPLTAPHLLCIRGARDPLKGDPVLVLQEHELQDAGCRAVLAGRYAPSNLRADNFTASFAPNGITDHRLYVDETRAPQLEELLLARKAILTIDLAVRADRTARFKAWHIDGLEPAAYFANRGGPRQ